jgi:hypothetical protein
MRVSREPRNNPVLVPAMLRTISRRTDARRDAGPMATSRSVPSHERDVALPGTEPRGEQPDHVPGTAHDLMKA